jgi:hypothetical protein
MYVFMTHKYKVHKAKLSYKYQFIHSKVIVGCLLCTSEYKSMKLTTNNKASKTIFKKHKFYKREKKNNGQKHINTPGSFSK